EYPQASGRVARLKDGRIGRFGWKSQKASLYDFTMTACAVELGLHVPDHPQAGSPHRPDYQPTGFDLNQDECNALVKYLKELPAPTSLATDNAKLRESLQAGERTFAKLGCAACHTPQLGEVAGIYSDLLLHDMGPDSGDSGNYGVFVPDSTASDSEDPIPELTAVPIEPGRFPVSNSQTLQTVPEDLKGAASQEWRTPPLWGVRDSAPYLHDGRAKTLEQAIAMHGGEGHAAAIKFFSLSKREQTSVLSFLHTLVAPDAIVVTK
ncbi:MAG TPA: di-heme oxidoredictase family protein, partial [Planctomycetaceae bacterium]|nr:di-heme oxidoredictase family protein [Planctomycetaceae bacterium]